MNRNIINGYLLKFKIWCFRNAIAIVAVLIAFIALWNENYKVDNNFKAILIHEDMEDFFVLANEGNRDQILIDYYYGYKYHPDDNYIGILGANNAEPIILKPGEKMILKPRWSLEHFIRTRTDTNYWFKDGRIDIKMKVAAQAAEIPFIVGMAFKYLDPSGVVRIKYFNYAIYTKDAIILEDPILDDEFIYLNN